MGCTPPASACKSTAAHQREGQAPPLHYDEQRTFALFQIVRIHDQGHGAVVDGLHLHMGSKFAVLRGEA